MAHCNDQEQYQAKPVLEASFKDLVFSLKDGEMTMVLKSDIKLKEKGLKNHKITTITFTYCPFCGVKNREDHD
ncbi:hypothetical protein [Psychrobacter sp. 72-O-c]|uniref:hypothetical protein n=1 Tax=Psychrobacter sp. 72-O-c TaxID=2774125 RepID=UPI00191A8DD6|nr:hypothetical protein [Psychrobacter sp. 72-O-c]